MDPRLIVVIVVALVVIGIAAWVILRARRTSALKSRFGPEYDRTVRERGPSKAEAALLDRQKRVEKFHIRELAADERERFITEWRVVQSRFVDDPKGAVVDADNLVIRLMQARGYPMADFDQRTADISVDHPQVVDNYRAAHQIALRERRGEETTEDLRNAIIYYRSLFDELLQTPNRKEVA